jgi:hypothetical protein
MIASQSTAAKSLSADVDAVHPNPNAVVVSIIVMPTRGPPSHASDAPWRQRSPNDSVRLVSSYCDAGMF